MVYRPYDTPENLGKYYRGTSHTYYAAKYWMQGLYNFTDDAPPQPFIPIVSYWDDYDMGPWALPHVYDYMEGRDAVYKEYPQMSETYNRRRYLTAYAKQQKTEFGDIIIDHNAEPDSYSGVVSVSETLVTLGDEGSATYKFTIDEEGIYDVAIRLCYPFWDNHWNTYHPGGREVCVHAFIGKLADGTIATYQTLPWNHRGWHAGGSANNTHIGFEICEDGLTDYAYFKKVYREAVELCAYLCKEYGLTEQNIICHSEGYKQGVASNHGDVMHWFPKHGKSMDTFRAEVKALLATADEEKDETPALWDIAVQYLGKGSRYTEIKKLNGLTSNVIYSGWKLKIPN